MTIPIKETTEGVVIRYDKNTAAFYPVSTWRRSLDGRRTMTFNEFKEAYPYEYLSGTYRSKKNKT